MAIRKPNRNSKPAARKPAAKKPAAKKPAAKKPAAKKPTTRKPAAKKPAAKKPTTRKPTTRKPAAKKPAVNKTVNVNPNDYVRLSENANPAKFNEMGQKVQKGLVKWSYYTIDGNVGYHYYLKLK